MEDTKFKRSGSLSTEISSREIEHERLARKLAQESIVLLKNNNILPLSNSAVTALFGVGGQFTVKGGIGSGDVNNRHSVSILEGLENRNIKISSKKWLEDYSSIYDAARVEWKEKILSDCDKYENPFDAYAANPFQFPAGRRIQEEDFKGADVAIYVISRISGEGKDRRLEEGDYYLSSKEREDLKILADQMPVILVINAGGVVEISDVLGWKNIDAVLQISDLGQAGGDAVCDVLFGDVTPSGHLTATWAREYHDYPEAESFGYLSGNLRECTYKEGILVGYRAFSTNDINPLFPFGFGLSYTEFSWETAGFKQEGDSFCIQIKVRNVGNEFSGKELVQCYVKFPESECIREKVRLVGFAKTDLLKPGQEEIVSIDFTKRDLASYYENENLYGIEPGRYEILLGKDVNQTNNAGLYETESFEIIEKTQKLEFEKPENKDQDRENLDVNTGEPETIQGIPVEECIRLLMGNITEGTSHLGSAGVRVPGSAGETSLFLSDKYNIPSLIMADGPAGLRLQQKYEVSTRDETIYELGVLGALDNGYIQPMELHEDGQVYYQYCTAFPVGSALAQTWNTDILQEFGQAIGREMEEFQINLWLAPGMNIMRNPLCGRNFEYFSEDPLLSGKLAAAITKGVQKHPGCGVTLKHFACNNQEDNRMGVNVKISERALREIYTRGFEIAVKEGKPKAIMTSYNLINGIHAANCKALCQTLLRDEWGFEGIVMSDWNTTVPEDGTVAHQCMLAGNDIIMPGNPDDLQDLLNAYHKGIVKKENIEVCLKRILRVIG